jgi:DNA-binding HxlR family transcriptional regulator
MAQRLATRKKDSPGPKPDPAASLPSESASPVASIDAFEAIRDINVFEARCPGHQVISRLGNKWTLLVMYALMQGTKRYTELQRQIKNISPKMLTQILRNLEKDGLVSRKVHPVVPPMVEYSLTPLGASLAEPLSGLCVWANENYALLTRKWRLGSE